MSGHYCWMTYSRFVHSVQREFKRYLSKNPQPVKPHKPKSSIDRKTHFVDFTKVRVTGGNGGDGMLCFNSIKFDEWAGPDGGDGGNGGHVIFKATRNKRSLNHVKSVLSGSDGGKGMSRNCTGKNAEHLFMEVPCGTIIRDSDGTMLTSLDYESDYYIAARGGAGGRGNKYFTSCLDTAPRKAEVGGKGECRDLMLELRVMASAGLIGFPNAGKSTLLRAISRARPKVASYPFTTLNPTIGMVNYDDHEQVPVADIPGLIKDAHKNYGLGISFLRHIERCKCLLFVIDLSYEEPWTQFTDLKYELEQYKSGLSSRPHAIIGNKIDVPGAKDNLRELSLAMNMPVYPVSAKYRIGIDSLLVHLRYMYDKYGKEEAIDEESQL